MNEFFDYGSVHIEMLRELTDMFEFSEMYNTSDVDKQLHTFNTYSFSNSQLSLRDLAYKACLLYSKTRNRTKFIIRKAKREAHSLLFQNCENSKSLWNCIRNNGILTRDSDEVSVISNIGLDVLNSNFVNNQLTQSHINR